MKGLGVTAVVVGLLLLYVSCVALGASGGQMGGTASSSSRTPTEPEESTPSSYSRGPGYYSFLGSHHYYAPTTSGAPSLGFGFGFVSWLIIFLVIAFLILPTFLSDSSYPNTTRTSVLKFQVGLLGTARSLQRDLNRIAKAADTNTSTPNGLTFVLQETTLALLRRPDYCISCYSSVDVKNSVEEGEKLFNQLSIEERGKLNEETLVNVNKIRKQSATSQRSNGFRNEYIVITVIVVAGGVHQLPPINSSAQLKEALQKLASIPSRRIMFTGCGGVVDPTI